MKIKLCGLSRESDIQIANELSPDYIGFVFWEKSKRYVTPDTALELRRALSSDILAVGVFVNETPDNVASLLSSGVIDIAQLHGSEDEEYISSLRMLNQKPIIKAFRIESEDDIIKAEKSSADYILLDSGMGTGNVFDWNLLQNIKRPFFLAGGLSSDNVKNAIKTIHPYALDVSSGIETDGYKDENKMRAFVHAVRGKED